MTQSAALSSGVTTPLLTQGLAYWNSVRGSRLLPARRDIDPVDIPKLLTNVLLIDVVLAPLQLRYRLVGSQVAARSVRDYTGMNIADLTGQKPPSRIWDLYERSIRERRPIVAHIPRLGHEHDPAFCVSILSAPLASDGQTVDMLFGMVDFSALSEIEFRAPAM